MSDEAALLKAIIANHDDDTPRLVYADWLDEHAPDATPSPALGPSARAEYIRVQCRLARRPYDDPDYPELLEREQDLASWLKVFAKDDPAKLQLPELLEWCSDFDSGPERTYSRGFPEQFTHSYEDYNGSYVGIKPLLDSLSSAFANSTVRKLIFQTPSGKELTSLVRSPVMRELRGLMIDNTFYELHDDAIRAIATSTHLCGLKDLRIKLAGEAKDFTPLTKATGLRSLESLWFEYPTDDAVRDLCQAQWFPNLRSLSLGRSPYESFKLLAELPKMPNLVELTIHGVGWPTEDAMRQFTTSESFQRLMRLEVRDVPLLPEQVGWLARGVWPLRHLIIHGCSLRKAGAEALVRAEFAESLRVLELVHCDITVRGIQALAGSAKLAGLKHLNLRGNPIGNGGLMAIARSKHLRGLRRLALSDCNSTKASIDSAGMLKFLSALDMPELRHLELDFLPVGARGAKIIARSFPNLTRLGLTACDLGDKGVQAIVESDSLTNLTYLDIGLNGAENSVAKLADSRVLPRLGFANLTRSQISPRLLSRLLKRPGVYV